MPFLLSTQNVLGYLNEREISNTNSDLLLSIQPKSGKNFNLLVEFKDKTAFLVKQEQHNLDGKTDEEFRREWYLQKLFATFPELCGLRSWLVEPLDIDLDRSVIVVEYLPEYVDLHDFYEQERFPVTVAENLGRALGQIHRSTFNQSQYEAFLTELNRGKSVSRVPRVLYGLERINVSVFQRVQQESLEFYRLFQRYESLGNAIAQLKASWSPCCLIHRDLRFPNVLVHPETGAIRIIDWEKFCWGDPAYDLGTVIAHYLMIWLRSLVIHKGLDLASTLKMARVLIAQLQPSLAALRSTYLEEFPDVDLVRSLQYAGAVLIDAIQIKLQYYEPFNNRDICQMQVAKTLLCQPEQAMQTVFGNSHHVAGHCS
ncbi:aminoglycoside phosphotransferase family protein [Pseudanabaenaceae cyanobacterium LEGE 13415]|nr:aminoglycoside phosphotransferase family protein [Pseudanabaenaceae cyanobacterium LEGE 13415]